MGTATLTGHTDNVTALAFSPTQTLLASADNDGKIILWGLATGKIQKTLKVDKPPQMIKEPVNALAFSPDGQTLAAGMADKTVVVWDVQTGTVRRTITGHPEAIKTVAFSPSGNRLVSGGNSTGFIKDPPSLWIWDDKFSSLTLPKRMASNVHAVAFRPYSSLFVCLDWSNESPHFLDAETMQELQCPFERPKDGKQLAFAPDGWRLAIAGSTLTGDNPYLTVYDLATGAAKPFPDIKMAVQNLAWSPDGKMLATVESKTQRNGTEAHLTLWDADKVKVLRRVQLMEGQYLFAFPLAFSPGGTVLATTGPRGDATLWAVADLLNPPPPYAADELKKIGTVSPKGKGVRIEVKPEVTDEQLAVLAKAPVVEIEMDYARNLTDAGLAHLKDLKDLRVLHLSGRKKSATPGWRTWPASPGWSASKSAAT